jgi:DNA-binding XRE family transcriptional regulator
MRVKNYLKKVREERMMSKAELARKAGLSVLTIDRIERGERCRHSTKRKVLEALGIDIADRHIVFPDEEEKEEGES